MWSMKKKKVTTPRWMERGAVWLVQQQRKICARAGERFNGWPRRYQRACVIGFCLLSLAITVSLLYDAFSSRQRYPDAAGLRPASATSFIGRDIQSLPAGGINYNSNIQMLYHLLDSLRRCDPVQYDLFIASHPGLLDSLQQLK